MVLDWLALGVLTESTWTLVRTNAPAGWPFARQPVTGTVLPSSGDGTVDGDVD